MSIAAHAVHAAHVAHAANAANAASQAGTAGAYPAPRAPRPSMASAPGVWTGQVPARRHRAFLIPIGLFHAGVLWALLQSMAPTILSPSTPTYIQWVPDAGPRAPVSPPLSLPAPERPSPQAPWMPVPDVVVVPTQAHPAAPGSPAAAPTPAEAVLTAMPVPAAASAVPARSEPPERQVSISDVAYLAPPVLDYPLASRRRREEGVVHVRVRVDVGGRPDQASVIRSSGHAALDQAALTTVRATRFKPYAEDGVPRAFWVVMPLVFELET